MRYSREPLSERIWRVVDSTSHAPTVDWHNFVRNTFQQAYKFVSDYMTPVPEEKPEVIPFGFGWERRYPHSPEAVSLRRIRSIAHSTSI